MSAPIDEPTAAVATSSGPSQKLRQLAGKRLRQLGWCILGLAVVIGILAIWRLCSLIGLPDVGDPFDVKAFPELAIPDDQNAFALLIRSHLKLTPMPELPRTAQRAGVNGALVQRRSEAARVGRGE